jgi:glycosyltransferase involved in cell wall biosynthesis
MSLPLSVFIICHNEVDRLGMVLESVIELTDDIIVVDSGSDDGTVELARQYTDRVYHRDWTGFGDQKVYGECLCKHDWILNLDADEVVSPELFAEICEHIRLDPKNREKHAGFEIAVKMMSSLNDRRPPSWLAPTNFTGRFYDRRYAGFANNSVHDKLYARESGSMKFPRLNGVIYHYSIKSYKHMWSKIGLYSEAQAQEWVHKGRAPRLGLVFLVAPLFFIKHFLLRRLFALGARGFVIALSLTAGRVLREVIAADLYSKRDQE